jgi:Ca-activated chloride channel homolog
MTAEGTGMKKVMFITVALILTTHLVFAQAVQQTRSAKQASSASDSDDDTITIDAALVNTHVSVRDKRGHSVLGLTKDDFTVIDDGKEQPIVYFSQESDQPLRIALVVDRSRSVQNVLSLAKTAAGNFLTSVLRPNRDRACVVAFDSGVYLTQDFTDDPNILSNALSRVTAEGGTSIFDAIYKVCRDKLSGTDQARRIILLITDGDDTTSRASIDQAIEMALKNNVTVFALRLPDENSLNVRNLRGKPVLERLTEMTGGRDFHFDGNAGQLAKFFDALQGEMRSQYSIGYRFQALATARNFHRIEIKIKEPNLKAFTRNGYYSE